MHGTATRRAVLVTSSFSLFVWGTAVQAAAVQWSSSAGGNDHYYEVVLVEDGISWQDASAAAQAAGGYLATLTSAAETAFVLDLVDDSSTFWTEVGTGTRGPWIGGLQTPGSLEPDGGWQWVTGEPFAYTNWADGEPNNNLIDEDFIELYYTVGDPLAATWNDLSNESGPLNPVAYIIETVPEPSTFFLGLLGFSAVWLKRRG